MFLINKIDLLGDNTNQVQGLLLIMYANLLTIKKT